MSKINARKFSTPASMPTVPGKAVGLCATMKCVTLHYRGHEVAILSNSEASLSDSFSRLAGFDMDPSGIQAVAVFSQSSLVVNHLAEDEEESR